MEAWAGSSLPQSEHTLILNYDMAALLFQEEVSSRTGHWTRTECLHLCECCRRLELAVQHCEEASPQKRGNTPYAPDSRGKTCLHKRQGGMGSGQCHVWFLE